MSTLVTSFPDIIDNCKYGKNIYNQSLEQYMWIDELYKLHRIKQDAANTAATIGTVANNIYSRIDEDAMKQTKENINIRNLLTTNIQNTEKLFIDSITNLNRTLTTEIQHVEQRLGKGIDDAQKSLYESQSTSLSMTYSTMNQLFDYLQEEHVSSIIVNRDRLEYVQNKFDDTMSDLQDSFHRVEMYQSSMTNQMLYVTKRLSDRLLEQQKRYNQYTIATQDKVETYVGYKFEEVSEQMKKDHIETQRAIVVIKQKADEALETADRAWLAALSRRP